MRTYVYPNLSFIAKMCALGVITAALLSLTDMAVPAVDSVTAKLDSSLPQASDIRIDVGSATPIMASSNTLTASIPFSITCGVSPEGESCVTSVTLYTRAPGLAWLQSPAAIGGVDSTFNVAVTGKYVDYYLEVTEASTAKRVFFPHDGPTAPLRLHFVSDVGPTLLGRLDHADDRPPDTVVRLPWGSGPGHAGLLPGNESSTVGPQALDVDQDGTIYLLDSVNKRVQVLSPTGTVLEILRLNVGPLGDIALATDRTAYVLDIVPEEPASSPVLHQIATRPTSSGVQILKTVQTPESEPALVRVVDETVWVYGTPSDSWRPVLGQADGGPSLQMGMPSVTGEVLRRVYDYGRIDIFGLGGSGVGAASFQAPLGQYFGELALVEPLTTGSLLVARTWQEEPEARDHHEVLVLRSDGSIRERFGIPNGEYAETAPLSEYRLGRDGKLYQLWSDASGLQIRSYSIASQGA